MSQNSVNLKLNDLGGDKIDVPVRGRVAVRALGLMFIFCEKRIIV